MKLATTAVSTHGRSRASLSTSGTEMHCQDPTTMMMPSLIGVATWPLLTEDYFMLDDESKADCPCPKVQGPSEPRINLGGSPALTVYLLAV